MMTCACPLPHELMEAGTLPKAAIERLLFEIVKGLLVHEPNFTAGNPVIFKMATDVNGVEVVSILHLQGVGKPIEARPGGAHIWTPENGKRQ